MELINAAVPRTPQPPLTAQSMVRAGRGSLTPAETQVVKLLCRGKSIKQVAGIRERSEKTVQAQVKAAKAKLGARSAVQLGFIAARLRDNR